MIINWPFAHPRLKSHRRSARHTFEALEERCLLALFLVNSSDDPGLGVCDAAECTLREAIIAANNNPGADDVQFNIGMGGAVSIQLKDALPPISDPINIDATTQPGFVAPGPPIVELNGSLVTVGNGLIMNTVASAIRGLVINRFRGSGILIQGGGGHRIAGNHIGADLTGMAGAGNGGSGILMLDSNGNTIGGAAAGEANVIIGNKGDGITIQAGTQNIIQGNFIGTNSAGDSGLGNAGAGISLQNALSNRIGGIVGAERNVIASNGGDGILVASGAQNLIVGNSIFSNGGLGIDLAPDGPNFPQDPDPGTGANDSQNFPLLASATASNNNTFVLGTLSSSPGVNFSVAFYASINADPSGFGEGQLFLGRVAAMTDASGFAQIDAALPVVAPPASVITATATHPNGDTSEFSPAIPLTVPQFQFDLNVRAFVSAVGAVEQLEVQYDIVGVPVPRVEFAFFASANARFDNADTEQPPRLQVANPADLTIGSHTIRFSGASYRRILDAIDIPFVLTRGFVLDAAGTVLVESDDSNNDINFIGLFHEPGMPLVIRGKDDTDRYVDDPDDAVSIAGGAAITVMADFLVRPVTIASTSITQIRVLGLGGDDSIGATSDVTVPVVVRGGAGDDILIGGRAADVLEGGAGDDVVGGRLGNDRLDGGAGSDTADFGVEAHAVVASLATGRARGQGRDTLTAIENLTGSPGRDRLTGDAGANVLFGGAGADLIVGGAGADIIAGGAGDDSIFGEAGDDTLDGDAGNDSVCGGDGMDMIAGGDGDDHLEGGNDDDDIRGGAGADFICGSSGNDLLAGNSGKDSLVGESGIDRLLGGADFDAILFDAIDRPFDLGGAGRDGGKAVRFG